MILCGSFIFFNDTATTEIYTLSLHDALPIFREVLPAVGALQGAHRHPLAAVRARLHPSAPAHGLPSGSAVLDRKSTRLNSSHANISYAVFCLKKKKTAHSSDRHSATYLRSQR